MNQPEPKGGTTSPVFVEDLFLTDVFLIKGRLPNKNKRLTNMLEDCPRTFLQVQDATMVSLRTNEVIRTPTVMVNVSEVIFAHELVEVAGDEMLRRLAAGNDKPTRIRAFYNGAVQFELAGMIEPGAYESQPMTGRKYFIMQKPMVRGLDLANPELALLKGLDYAIVRKDRMAYVYDFS
ncbi:MAG: hypothetical protein Q7T30_00255 [Planctomycetota bacterium]|nr:hypothetical protein [Planctomycetota bacterium]